MHTLLLCYLTNRAPITPRVTRGQDPEDKIMDRRHLQVIAEIIAKLPNLGTRVHVMRHFADELAKRVPNFDDDRFFRAVAEAVKS